MLTCCLLDQWGLQGFTQVKLTELYQCTVSKSTPQHIGRVESFYRGRRDLLVAAADRHLAGLAEFSVPLGGMFLWLRVPGVTDTWDMIMQRGIAKAGQQ